MKDIRRHVTHTFFAYAAHQCVYRAVVLQNTVLGTRDFSKILVVPDGAHVEI